MVRYVLALTFGLASPAPALSEDSCLLRNTSCVEVRTLFESFEDGTDFKAFSAKLGDILVADFFSDYPQSDQMDCLRTSSLSTVLAGTDFSKRIDRFHPGAKAGTFVEYVTDSGQRYCHFIPDGSGPPVS